MTDIDWSSLFIQAFKHLIQYSVMNQTHSHLILCGLSTNFASLLDADMFTYDFQLLSEGKRPKGVPGYIFLHQEAREIQKRTW